uniref:Uncharacterized protein n=1 Tax=Globodera rostochiensis TaxID=31243 RepID=A0A914I1F2_GLORO
MACSGVDEQRKTIDFSVPWTTESQEPSCGTRWEGTPLICFRQLCEIKIAFKTQLFESYRLVFISSENSEKRFLPAKSTVV